MCQGSPEIEEIYQQKDTVMGKRQLLHTSLGSSSYARRRADIRQRVDFLHSGGTPLNLALSGFDDGGWARRRVLNVVGDGSTGKTLLALEMMYAAYKAYLAGVFGKKKLILRYQNIEGVMDFPLTTMYGKKFEKFISWERPETIEQWGRRLNNKIRLLRKNQILIDVTDSLDAFQTEAARKRALKAMKNDTEETGAYRGAEVAGYLSQSFFGSLCNQMVDKDATVLFISQVRKKIGDTWGDNEYRIGGKAMDTYTHQVLWVRKRMNLTRRILGDDTVYGIYCEAKIKRSKVSRPFKKAPFVVLWDYGLDNLWSCIIYLYGVKKKKSPYKWDGEEFQNPRAMISYIEKKGQEQRLIEKVVQKHERIDQTLQGYVDSRKPRY